MHPVIYRVQDYLAGRPLKARSSHWHHFRGLWLADPAHAFCAVCGYTKGLNLHHIRPFHLQPDLELDPNNVITLGESCPTGNHHLAIGHFGNYSKWNPDVVELAALLLANFKQAQAGFMPLPLFKAA